jgi:curved DNA-binding protein CbpA
MLSESDYYQILGVSIEATGAQIRSAYHRSVKLNHPDLFASYVKKAWANERMVRINAAYATLGDPRLRAAYDARRHRPRTVPARRKRSDSRSDQAPVSEMPRASRFSTAGIVSFVAWLIASVVFAWFWMPELPGPVARLIGFALGLLVTPFLFLIIVATLAIPAAVMTNAFRSGYADGRAKPITGLKMLRDFMIRLVSLGVVAVLQVLAFRAGLQFDLLYLGLLAAGASFAGEMLAIAVYAVRRVRVDRTTTALVRLHDAGSTLPAE